MRMEDNDYEKDFEYTDDCCASFAFCLRPGSLS